MNSIIVGITGASGAIYGIRILEELKKTDVTTHLVISKAAHITIKEETNLAISEIQNLADVYHNVDNIAATIASGSFRSMGMVIAPCSIRTMSEIATGTTSSLLTRAADVVLKERRRLVLMVRETPLHSMHLYNMAKLSDAGAIIAPPLPAFYTKPETIDDIINNTVGRTLNLFDIETNLVTEWSPEK